MKRLISQLLIFSLLLQPLFLISPVYAEEIKMEYTDPHHLHAPKIVNGVTYQYDENGNLVNDGERIIEWNQDNLPVRITKSDTEVKFFYDAQGQRIVKQSGQNKTIYVNQYYQLSVISNQSSATKYYFANGKRIATSHQSLTTIHQPFTNHLPAMLRPPATLRVAMRAGIALQAGQQPVTNFYHHDHLGSTVLTTDTNSQPLFNSFSYFPYGNSLNNETIGQLNNLSYLFTNQELDLESDLYNYNARLYNPKTGVFISADTVGSGNRYAYANNNPMVFVDPSGHDPWTWITRLISGGSKVSLAGQLITIEGGVMYLSGKAMGAFWNWLEPYALKYAEVEEMFHGGGEERIKAQYAKGTQWAESMQSIGENLIYAGAGLEFLGEASQLAGSVLGNVQAGKELSLESKYFTESKEPTQALLDARRRLYEALDMYKTEDYENIFVIGSQVNGDFEPASDLDILIQTPTNSPRNIRDAMSEQTILKELNPLYNDDEIFDFFFSERSNKLVKEKGPFIHVFWTDKPEPFLGNSYFDLQRLEWVKKNP